MNLLPRNTAARLLGVGLIVACWHTCARAEPPPSSFGVWDRGDTFDPKQYPFLRGLSFNASWSELEKQPGVFDWSRLDQAVEKALQNRVYLYLSLGAGPEAPEWIYQNGVPKVFTDDERHLGKWACYPYYLARAYRTFFTRLITEFGRHIRTYPEEKQRRIAFVQVKTGCTGDEAAYKGEPKESKYALAKTSAAWRDFRLDTFALFVKLFQESPGPRIDLLFNSVGGDAFGDEGFAEEWKRVTTHLKGGFGIKNGALSRGHHLSGERTLVEQWNPYLIDQKGLTLFRRSEMDQTWTKPWYQLNVPLNFYWGAVNALNSGQSVWDITKRAIEEAKSGGFEYSFYFFNKYAGQIHPETATAAFCALHKGLDAADTKVYPEEKYGKATPKNLERMLKICAQFAAYGASADDPDALTIGQVGQRREQKGFNDVGWQIWPDNYTRFLHQIDADATSVPRWRVGGPITPSSSIYSRFARGFEHASGKDALYFQLHENFFPDRTPKTVTIRVVWYDAQAGSTWKLAYDAGDRDMKTALTVTGTGDRRWHDQIVTLHDAVMRRGGTKGSDLVLMNTDDQDDIFSLIEVNRGIPAPLPAADTKSTSVQPAAPAAETTKRGKRKAAK
jgi:hypothetical protein